MAIMTATLIANPPVTCQFLICCRNWQNKSIKADEWWEKCWRHRREEKEETTSVKLFPVLPFLDQTIPLSLSTEFMLYILTKIFTLWTSHTEAVTSTLASKSFICFLRGQSKLISADFFHGLPGCVIFKDIGFSQFTIDGMLILHQGTFLIRFIQAVRQMI